MAQQADQVGFFQTFIEEIGPQELSSLPQEAHSTAPLLNYMKEHGVPIAIPEGMDASKLDKAFRYGAHTPELKE